MAGLFVQKHVDSVRAQGVDVRIIHSQTFRDTWRQWCTLQREGWIPDVVQLNVIQKQGLLALWLKKRYGIPYVIMEHWSGYLTENGAFRRFGVIKKHLMHLIGRKAEGIFAVSQKLQTAMSDCGFEAKQWGTIDNVVDDFFFERRVKNRVSGIKTLLHVCCFDERAKNVKGLLRAAKMLSEKRQDWQLTLVGTGVDYEDVRAYADCLQFPKGLLVWTGEVTPREVAQRMHQSDALVLSSRYETYGVVLAEATAAGLPILSTPVGIAKETSTLLVPQEIAQNKPDRFAEFIETILWRTNKIEKRVQNEERYSAKRFTAETIGKKLTGIYDSCLHHDI